ncbi:hypothetical protein [Klebsiella pneumoniae]
MTEGTIKTSKYEIIAIFREELALLNKSDFG